MSTEGFLVTGATLLGIGWLFRNQSTSDRVHKPGPLLMVPLTGSELASQAGLSRMHEERLGHFPPDMIAAIDKYLEDGLEPVESAAPGVGTIFFKPGEPRTFDEYGGQQHILQFLRANLQGIGPNDTVRVAPMVFSGAAGSGKTLLAKVMTNEMRAQAVLRGQRLTELIEVFTTEIPNVAALDALMRRVQSNPGCVVFLDEVHGLEGKEHWQKFLEVLENNRYLFEGEPYPSELPPFTLLSATTDYGRLSAPWRRRLLEQRFLPSSYEEILSYVKNRRVLPVADAAATEIVDRTHWGGAPWEALWAYSMAVVFAKARASTLIELPDVTRVWEVNQVDNYGLRPVDRDVMKALFRTPRHRRDRRTGEQEFVAYAASEDNVCQMAGVDRAEYRDYIRPKLMNRGLLEIRISYGQSLTQQAVERYGYLREVA